MIDNFLADEPIRFALAAGLSVCLVAGIAVVVALRAREAKWKRLRMRGDSRAKCRELQRRQRRSR